jgi:hypothetical protein
MIGLNSGRHLEIAAKRGDEMGLVKRNEVKWRFYWKNIDGLGRINRVLMGLLALAGAYTMKDDPKKAMFLVIMSMDFFFAALLGWCPGRALLKMPSRKAFRKHYPKGA